jgi:ribosomal-protein-alanine N-acetyltransferase
MLLPRIETGRLILRTYKTEDLETVYKLCTDADVTRFFHQDYSVKREDVLTSLPRRRLRWKTQGIGQFGAFEKNGGRLIGYCGLQFLDNSEEVEIYYGFFKEFWGKGFATEVARSVLRFAFETVNLNRVAAVTHLENYASQKILLRLGFERGLGEYEFYGVRAAYFSAAREKFNNEGFIYSLSFEELEEPKHANV